MRRSLTIAVAGAGVLLTACGGPVQTNAGGAPANPIQHTPAATSSSSTSTTQEQQANTGTPKCTSADVKGEFGPLDADHVTLAEIIATNTSTRTCTVHGYGGLEIHTGGDGADLHVTLTREPSPAPATVTLAPGAKAYKKLTWAFPTDPSGDKTGCKQGASYAYVTLPDDVKTFEVHPEDPSTDLGDICSDVSGYAWSAKSTMGN